MKSVSAFYRTELSGAPKELFMLNCVQTSEIMLGYNIYDFVLINIWFIFSNSCSSLASQLDQIDQ